MPGGPRGYDAGKLRQWLVFMALPAVAGLLLAACSGSPSGPSGSLGRPSGSPAPPAQTATASSAAAEATPSGTATPGATSPGSPGGSTGPGDCTIPPASQPPTGLTFDACYRMSGEVSGEGGFVDDEQGGAAPGCAAWAQVGSLPAGLTSPVLFLPDPGDGQATVDGQPIGFYLEIAGYHGPGSYGLTGVAESATYGDTLSWSTNADKAATFSAQINPDGSGSVTVSSLRNDSSDGHTEAVSESWTCTFAASS